MADAANRRTRASLRRESRVEKAERGRLKAEVEHRHRPMSLSLSLPRLAFILRGSLDASVNLVRLKLEAQARRLPALRAVSCGQARTVPEVRRLECVLRVGRGSPASFRAGDSERAV